MKNICVYCGSRPGRISEYVDAADDLATAMVERNIGLVYGGGARGIMGAVADAMLVKGGRATGIMPKSLLGKERPHEGLTELHSVVTMHERKALMAELSDGFVALPGGLGTLEEILEMFTWAQLGFHQSPCGLLNVDGYYDLLVAFFRHAQTELFVEEVHVNMLIVEADPARLLDRFESYNSSA